MKTLPLIIVLAFILNGNLHAQNSTQKAEIVLTTKDQQNSNLFKSLKGSDRLKVFEDLQPIIKIKQTVGEYKPVKSQFMGAKTATLAEVIALLGEPDVSIQRNLIQYNLKDNASACKVLIGTNKADEITFCTIKNCK